MLFTGLTFFVLRQTQGMMQERVTLRQEDSSSPNRYSKTFGREQALDKLLASADDQELLKNLAADPEPAKGKAEAAHSKQL